MYEHIDNGIIYHSEQAKVIEERFLFVGSVSFDVFAFLELLEELQSDWLFEKIDKDTAGVVAYYLQEQKERKAFDDFLSFLFDK